MNNDWIIDVLRDLKKFSASNKLDHLAEHLDDTIMIAMSELASNVQSPQTTAGNLEQADRYARGTFVSDNA